MAEQSIGILLTAENQMTAELIEAEKSFVQFQKTLDAETKAIERYRISVEEGEEALYAFDLQMKGLDETTAKTLARQRQLITETSRQTQTLEKNTTSTGKATKTATEFIGTLAGLTGSSEIASFAGQLGNLSEKTEQFAEAGQKGGAGAFAFKAGLVAAVAAIAFSAGKFLGDIIFQTSKWADELEKAKKRSDELNASLAKMQQSRFMDTKTDIQLLGDPEEQQKAYQELFDSINKELAGVETRKQKAEQEITDLGEKAQAVARGAAISINPLQKFGAAFEVKGIKESIEAKSEEVKVDRERVKVLQEQRDEIQRAMTIEKERSERLAEATALKNSQDYVKSLRDQLELLKATGDEQRNIQAEQSGAVGADVGEASMLLAEIEQINQLKEQEKQLAEERKKAADDAIAAQKKIEELKNSELQKLEEERILLEKGKEAAAAFRLEKQGLAKDDAERIAQMQAELEKEREMKTQREASQKQFDAAINQPLQAQTSRFLTRGPTEDKTSRLVDLSKSQLETNQKAAAALDRLVALQQEKKPAQQLKLVEVN